MIVEKVDQAREVTTDIQLDGTLLSVAGVKINLEEEEADSQVLITVSLHGGIAMRQPVAGGEYIADIIIPPRRYEPVDDIGEDGEIKTESVPLPIDINSVVLRLWPISAKSE